MEFVQHYKQYKTKDEYETLRLVERKLFIARAFSHSYGSEDPEKLLKDTLAIFEAKYPKYESTI